MDDSGLYLKVNSGCLEWDNQIDDTILNSYFKNKQGSIISRDGITLLGGLSPFSDEYPKELKKETKDLERFFKGTTIVHDDSTSHYLILPFPTTPSKQVSSIHSMCSKFDDNHKEMQLQFVFAVFGKYSLDDIDYTYRFFGEEDSPKVDYDIDKTILFGVNGLNETITIIKDVITVHRNFNGDNNFVGASIDNNPDNESTPILICIETK